MGRMHTPSRRGAGRTSRRTRRRFNDTPTPAEAALARALTDLGIKYTQNAIVRTAEAISGGCYYTDFKLPDHKLFIELDGKPHTGEAAQWRDRLRTEAILRAHPTYRLTRAWNADVLKDPHTWIQHTLNTHSRESQPAKHPGSSPHVELVAEHVA